jgi:hypothetical protein
MGTELDTGYPLWKKELFSDATHIGLEAGEILEDDELL